MYFLFHTCMTKNIFVIQKELDTIMRKINNSISIFFTKTVKKPVFVIMPDQQRN